MTSSEDYDLKKLKRTGVMKQKSGELFSVRLKVVGGHVSAEQLRTLANAADAHGVGHVHLTTRQGVEIPNVPYKHIAPLQQILAAGALEFGDCGARVRTITACQGGQCTYGIINSQAIAGAVDEYVQNIEDLPHKFKIAITGCPNGCIKPQENDLGIMGQSYIARDANACVDCGLCAEECPTSALQLDDGTLTETLDICRNCGRCLRVCPTAALSADMTGYAVFVGGKMGNEPRLADRLPFRIAELQALLEVIGATLQWYADDGKTKERFGATIDRVGLDNLIEHLSGQVVKASRD